MHNFYFADKWLSYFGGRIISAPQHEIPVRDVSSVEIPYRDGDILLDNGRWQNVDFEREICFLPYLSELSAKHLARAVIEWLTLNRGYQKYKDTYNPGYFTEAYISNVDDIVRELPSLLTTKIKFNRQPWWHSETGQKAYTLTAGETLILKNPENYIAKPKIIIDRVKNDTTTAKNTSYALDINGKTTSYTTAAETQIIIDGETMQYTGQTTNKFISDFLPPDIAPQGYVTVTATNITNAVIRFIPQWRRL